MCVLHRMYDFQIIMEAISRMFITLENNAFLCADLVGTRKMKNFVNLSG